jgi:hypothetical protein
LEQEKQSLILFTMSLATQPTDESVLVEVDHGIYSLDGKLDFDVPGRLIVAMHPYFLYPGALPLGYLDRVDRIFANHQGPVLTFDEDTEKSGRGVVVERTAGHISGLDPNGERYFVKTVPYGPQLSEFSDFSPVINFIKKFKESLFLTGGLVHDSLFAEQRGCLVYFKSILEQNNIQADYIPGCTF